ncbi:dormancy/auxin associated domain-containing protein [Elysia marginata]|uniref:Dormancy/auxin associated domain-containing protein n=1 Tax=Elysia marginata TaxID=1093978 RepID=A0AAV4I0R3_9GAST|nr:dormancy/auxin associated domain-containing protein [Elysia marginata]
MTEEEKAAYFAERERKKKLIEEKRRAKYGDKYDEMMKKRQAKKEAEAVRKAEEQAKEEERRQQEEAFNKAEEDRKRRASLRAKELNLKNKEKPKSMVTYDKGPPRWPQDKEKSELNKENLLHAHERRNSRTMTSESQRRTSRGGDDLEGGKFLKLPPIKGKRGSFSSEEGDGRGRRGRKMHPRGETIDRNLAKVIADEEGTEEDDNIEIGEDGKLRLKKGKKIDLSKLSDDMLKKLGIDPNMTAKEKAKMLKKLFGSDIMITEGSYVIGTKGIDEYDLDEVTDEMLAADMNLDLDTISGQRRMNILFRRGGMLLRDHMKKVIDQSKLIDDPAEVMTYRNDLDERGGIDFMQHYRLVDPAKIEAYAKAFVVEDGDLDTVINIKEALTALDGVPGIQHMTTKQFDYVFKVLNIDDASQVTFRMFAVITALCERVTCMDDLSKHLLEICNLADIERKLQLYRDMFYHNVQAGLDPNFITSDSLKIELIAGGLSWLQQQYVMEKMEIDIASQVRGNTPPSSSSSPSSSSTSSTSSSSSLSSSSSSSALTVSVLFLIISMTIYYHNYLFLLVFVIFINIFIIIITTTVIITIIIVFIIINIMVSSLII